jgi:hypothetical protein
MVSRKSRGAFERERKKDGTQQVLQQLVLVLLLLRIGLPAA